MIINKVSKSKGKSSSEDAFKQHGECSREFLGKVFINDCICC